jgi:diketogulonate reductase-like aldo/keto reductase
MMLLYNRIYCESLTLTLENVLCLCSARNMTSSSRLSRVTLPEFIYGTAWKKDQTKRLVKEALDAGFRKVDTAAQPKHYQEDLVGEGLRDAYTQGIVRRKDLIVRLKYAIITLNTYKSRCKPNSLNRADKI